MKKAVLIFAVCTLLCGTAAAERSTIVGTIDLIEKDYISVGGKQYKLLNEFSDEMIKIKHGFETEYWVLVSNDNGTPVRSYQVNFNTLAGVGYVDKAKVIFRNGMVSKIEVIDLQQ